MLDGILSRDVDAHWAEAEPWIVRALDAGGGHFTADDIRAGLRDRAMQLWLWRDAAGAAKGALVTEIVAYPRLKVCRLVLAGAADGARRDWLRWRGLIEAWARAEGCSRVELYGRPGWTRILRHARRRIVLEWPI